MRLGRMLVVAGALLLAAMVVSAGGAGESATTQPIKIGVGGAHSGDLASYGIPTIKAAELVVEKVNAEGGVLGRQIQLVVEDDQCKPEVATNTATKLVGEGVVAVIGHICSGATKAALSIYNSSQVIAISPSATNPPLTQSGENPYFFRTIAPDDAQARLEVDFAVDTLGLKRIAVLHDKGDYGKGLAEFAQQFLQGESGVQVVLFEGITPGAVDYSAVINKIQAANADGVIFGGYHPEASKLVTQMRKKQMDTVFISDDGVKDDTFIKVAGEFAEGVYATGPVDTSASPLAAAAIKAHQEKYGEDPGPFFLNAYAAVTALVNAIEAAGSTDTAAIVKALRSEKVDTTLGNITFDQKGDAIGVGFQVFQVRNGSYAEVN